MAMIAIIVNAKTLRGIGFMDSGAFSWDDNLGSDRMGHAPSFGNLAVSSKAGKSVTLVYSIRMSF